MISIDLDKDMVYVAFSGDLPRNGDSYNPTSSQSTGKLRVQVYLWVGLPGSAPDTTRLTPGYTCTRGLPVRLPLVLLGKGIIGLWLWLDVGLWESRIPM